MRLQNQFTLRASLAGWAVILVGLNCQPAVSAEDTDPSVVEAQARQEVLTSARWAAAKQQFNEWLSIQTVYSKEEVQAMESELRNRIATMSAQELQIFLEEMEAKVQVLMSPATIDARRWADKYYTEKAQQRIRKKYGVEDPIRMPAEEIAAAVREFGADRLSQQSANTSFQSSRASQAQAGARQRQAQANAARSAARSRPAASSSYAPRSTPRNPKTYRTAYPKMGYSVGPWGGVWLNRGSR